MNPPKKTQKQEGKVVPAQLKVPIVLFLLIKREVMMKPWKITDLFYIFSFNALCLSALCLIPLPNTYPIIQ